MLITTKACPGCGGTEDLDVDADGYFAWLEGELIQRAFPTMSADDRERLITGFCPPCWAHMFGEE